MTERERESRKSYKKIILYFYNLYFYKKFNGALHSKRRVFFIARVKNNLCYMH